MIRRASHLLVALALGVVATPVAHAERHVAEAKVAPSQARSRAGARVVRIIRKLKRTVKTTKYQHWNTIRRRSGYYAWDCSGMAMWILRRAAPRALRALRRRRPAAIDFYKAIARAPTKRARAGWRQLSHISQVRPGDVFAFPRSPVSRSKTTGHVGFFVERPWRVKGIRGAWAARIADATRIPHEKDTRRDNPDGGFGFGTFMFLVDAEGRTYGYGWAGTRSRGYLPTHVVYGRVTR